MVQTVNRHFLHQIKHNHDPKHPNLHLPCFGPMHEGTEHILQPPDTRRRTLTDIRQMIVSCLDTKLFYRTHSFLFQLAYNSEILSKFANDKTTK